MSLTTGEMSAADLAAVVGNSNGNGGFGFGNGEGWWIILLFLLLGNNGWGNGFGGGSNGGVGGLFYPFMNQNETINDGFRDQMINNNITGIRDSIGNLSTQLCNCCCDMRDTVNQGFYNSEIAAANRQMANMNQAFGLQNAISSGFNATQAQLANCCCENRAATADLKYTIATENCADRAAISDGIRDVIASQTAGVQRILDQLCNDKIDAKNDEIAQLRQQLNMATLRESQTAQNAFIQRGFSDEVDQLYNRLSNCPVPSTPVYGRTPIFTCNQNQGCGCGCGSF